MKRFNHVASCVLFAGLLLTIFGCGEDKKKPTPPTPPVVETVAVRIAATGVEGVVIKTSKPADQLGTVTKGTKITFSVEQEALTTAQKEVEKWTAQTTGTAETISASKGKLSVEYTVTSNVEIAVVLKDKEKEVEQPQAFDEKIPLTYLSEGWVNVDKNGFTRDKNQESISFYKFNEAVAFAAKGVNIKGAPYHLPTIKEWRTIIPSLDEEDSPCVDFDSDVDEPRQAMEVVQLYGKKPATYKALYKVAGTPGNKVVYAIRFIGTESEMGTTDHTYLSVWRYRTLGSDKEDERTLELAIDQILLGSDAAENLADENYINRFVDEAAWANPSAHCKIPALGYDSDATGSGITKNGQDGYFWASDVDKERGGVPGMVIINKTGIETSIYIGKRRGTPLLLFKGNAPKHTR